MFPPVHCKCSGFKSLTQSLALLLVFSLQPTVTFGEWVDSATAGTVARNFYLYVSANGTEANRKGASAEVDLELVFQEFEDPNHDLTGHRKGVGHPLYYVFNVLADKGFVIVAGDEHIQPILGYALKGVFRKSHQPPAFQAWMESYKAQIMFALEHDLRVNSGIMEEWKSLKGGNLNEKNMTERKTRSGMVAPLVSTKWSQGCPYNAHCPSDTNGPCNRAYAGCGAVAMAQIMNYWEYPVTCRGLEGYHDQANTDTDWQVIPGSDYGWIEADAPSAYDWSIMPDELSDSSRQREIDEVSRLIFHCGVSIQTNYGPEGSPSNGADMVSALTECFNYSASLQYLRRQNYSPEAWKNLIKVELDMGRPVLYFGEGKKGGHGFVCDGYDQNGFFHFNWGWGGANDEYYSLDAMVPGSVSLVDAQRVIIGICPEFTVSDPCENIISIKGEGILHAQSFQGGNQGSWSHYLCGWSTPGREQVYRFIAPSTGLFRMVVTETDNYVDCAWKEKECGPNGWNCIGDICTPGIYGPMSWKAGETYYVLADDEDTISGDFEFFIEPEVSTGQEQNRRTQPPKVIFHQECQIITVEAAQNQEYAVDLWCVNGGVIYAERNIEAPWQLNVSFLPDGIYFLTLRSNDLVNTSKIVKY